MDIINTTIRVGKYGKKTVEIEIRVSVERPFGMMYTTKLDMQVSETYKFSMTGGIYNPQTRDYEICGQCQDRLRSIADRIVYEFPKEKFLRLLEIWDAWHLNDMIPGTESQQLAVAIWRQDHKYSYTEACAALAEVGLLEDHGYKYGSAWLYRELPREVIAEVKDLLNW